MGYGGDAHATTATGMDNFKTAALYSKWAEDWRDVQGKAAAWGVGKKEGEVGSGKQIEPGNLPYTAPTYWGGGGPGWSGYCVTLPWEMYRHYGDSHILEQMLPTIERWLAFLETKARDDLLRRYGGEWDFLGDWLWPGAKGVNGDTRETLFFNNCYWVYNLQTAARIADAIGHNALASHWRSRADSVRQAIHREFFNPADKGYVNGFEAYLAIALVTGVPPRELRTTVMNRLEEEILLNRKGHFWGGITGGSFVIKELIDADRPDLMFTMATQESYPGWGNMLKKGATTIWEDWEGNLSLCHSSYLHIGAWFIEGLAGIRPGTDGHGYQHFVLKPGAWSTCPLQWTKCRFDSPYGPIESNWRRDGENVLYDILVPPNTTSTVSLPGEAHHSLTESGKPLARAQGVHRLGNDGARVLLRLEPGQYLFESK
jgi:alpha-L-rhamnosidase